MAKKSKNHHHLLQFPWNFTWNLLLGIQLNVIRKILKFLKISWFWGQNWKNSWMTLLFTLNWPIGLKSYLNRTSLDSCGPTLNELEWIGMNWNELEWIGMTWNKLEWAELSKLWSIETLKYWNFDVLKHRTFLTSNYANYAKMRFFQDLESIANASTHFILA